MASISSSPRTVEEIFKVYSARRAGILRALTIDVEDFSNLCDPEKENLCLYGHPTETWEVNLPVDEVPPELPEPALGINFARDGMNRRDWLSLVAVHSDCWLLSMAYFFGARLNRNERKRLHSLINDLPTVFEVAAERKPIKDKPSADSGSKSCGSIKRTVMFRQKPLQDWQMKVAMRMKNIVKHYTDAVVGITMLTSFGLAVISEIWFHGKCVKITPAKAEGIKQYNCPACSFKRSRP